jgi:hypothetical protein
VLELIDILDGIATPAWGDYSQDVDRSGTFAPPDIPALIDLLNGAAAYDQWLDTPLPSATGCP